MVTTFYQTGPNGLFIFYQVFNLILQSAKIYNYSNLTNLSNIGLRDKYQEIISVDLSIPELRSQGLYCQKVIGVGGKSMVFDYHLASDMPKYLPLA